MKIKLQDEEDLVQGTCSFALCSFSHEVVLQVVAVEDLVMGKLDLVKTRFSIFPV